ncbi:hypothetical protein BH11ACT6_BH11ACT6_17330 [soil metagenome]
MMNGIEAASTMSGEGKVAEPVEGSTPLEPAVWSDAAAFGPLRGVGDFFAMTLDVLIAMVKPPFPWREFLVQTWFVARVALLPTLMFESP